MRKKFKRSVGFYYSDSDSRDIILWHNCSRKPFRLPEQYNMLITQQQCGCFKCGQPIDEWMPMHRVERARKDGAYIKFNYKSHIEIDADDTSVNIDIFQTQCNLWKDKIVILNTDGCVRLVIDVKHGYTYTLYMTEQERNGGFGKKGYFTNIGHGNNGTLYDYNSVIGLSACALTYIYTLVSEKVKQFYGADTPDFKSYNTALTLENLIRYAMSTHIDPALYGKLRELSCRHCHGYGTFPKGLTIKNDCGDPVAQIIRQSRIPPVKSLKRIAYTNPENIMLLALLSCSFQNVDLIRSLYLAYAGEFYNGTDSYIDFSAKVFQVMIQHKGEKSVASKLLRFARRDRHNNVHTMLVDIISFFNTKTHCNFDFTESYDIEDLHMYLTSSVVEKEIVNRKIEYSEKELSFVMTDETYSITPAKDTFEMIDVGTAMSICVSGYADYAVNKGCSIYVLRKREDDKPVGCIELRGNRVVQVKGKYNKLLKGAAREFVERWIDEKRLRIDTYDLPKAIAGKQRKLPA